MAIDQPTNGDSRNDGIPPQKTPFERSRFGGSVKPPKTEDEVPVSKSDLKKGPEKLSLPPVTKINWSVLIVSSVVIAAFSAWAIVSPVRASATMETVVTWIATSLGWYYVLTMVLVIFFVVWVALSKAGSVRLGPDDSRPQYGLGTWAAMLFAAGVGIDLLFFSATGPVVQYLTPPAGDSASL